jgi:hypothetical protein
MRDHFITHATHTFLRLHNAAGMSAIAGGTVAEVAWWHLWRPAIIGPFFSLFEIVFFVLFQWWRFFATVGNPQFRRC